MHVGLHKPENNLKTNDILGARPQCVKFTTNRIGTNPLNPTYTLQKVEFVAPEPTRFIRDQLSIDDIEGAKPAKKKQLDIKTRDILNINDIEGTKPQIGNVKMQRNKTSYDNMNYRDVTHDYFKTTRSTNPLIPTYVHRDEDGNKIEIGPVQGCIPQVLPPPRKDLSFVNTSLTTKDIMGCAVGTKGLGNFHSRERRAIKQINQTSDIFGAQPGSLKKAPVTKRCLHPLNPDYQYPGRLQLENQNDAYGASGSSAFQRAAQQSLGMSKLQSASRKASEIAAQEVSQLPDNPQPAVSAKASERSAKQSDAPSKKSNA